MGNFSALIAEIEDYGRVQGYVGVRFLRWDMDRAEFAWFMKDHDNVIVAEGQDLRSGSGDYSLPKMLASLCDFLTSFAEARDEHSDNWNMFPEAARGYAKAWSDELSSISLELDPQER